VILRAQQLSLTDLLEKGSPEPILHPRPKAVSHPKEEWNYTPDFLDLSRFWRTIAVKKTEHDYVVIAELLTPPPACPDCNSRAAKQRPNVTIVQTKVVVVIDAYLGMIRSFKILLRL
jgi:hypothetical protein